MLNVRGERAEQACLVHPEDGLATLRTRRQPSGMGRTHSEIGRGAGGRPRIAIDRADAGGERVGHFSRAAAVPQPAGASERRYSRYLRVASPQPCRRAEQVQTCQHRPQQSS